MKQKEADNFEYQLTRSSLFLQPRQVEGIMKILNSLVDNYTATLEQKLKDIECGECGKNLLECQCNEEKQ